MLHRIVAIFALVSVAVHANVELVSDRTCELENAEELCRSPRFDKCFSVPMWEYNVITNQCEESHECHPFMTYANCTKVFRTRQQCERQCTVDDEATTNEHNETMTDYAAALRPRRCFEGRRTRIGCGSFPADEAPYGYYDIPI